MERPLAVIGFSYLAAMAAALLFAFELLPLLIIISILASLFFMIFPRVREQRILPVISLTAAFAFIWLLCFSEVYVAPAEKLYGKTAIVEGQICELPFEQNGRYYYKLKTEHIYREKAVQNTVALVSSKKKIPAEPYDTVRATVHFYSQTDDSFRFYNISRRNYLTGYIDIYKSIQVNENDEKPLYYYALRIRQKMLETIDENFLDENASFVSAVLLGDKSSLSYEDMSAFRTAGISHIIVVSGFHLALISQIMMAALTVILIGRKRLASMICIVFVFLYMAIAGFNPSIVRAGVMQIMILFAQTIIMKADSLNSLGLSALIICFINPYTCMDIGFLLSFFATLGICLWSGRMYNAVYYRIYPEDNPVTGHLKAKKKESSGLRRIKKAVFKAVISISTVTIGALALTIPLAVLFFKTAAPYTVLSNLLTAPAVSVLICTALMTVITGMILPGLNTVLPFAAVTKLLSDYITGISGWICTLPFAIIKVTGEYVPVCFVVSVIIAVIFILHKKGKVFIRAMLCICMIIFTFCCGYLTEYIIKKDSVKLFIADSGGGITLILSDYDSTDILSCGGKTDKYQSIKQYINNLPDSDIDYLLIPDNTAETSGYAERIIDRYNVETIHVYDEDRLKKRMQSKIEAYENVLHSSKEQNRIELCRLSDANVHILNTNECCALYIEIYNTGILVCENGTDCSIIPEKWREADLLIDGGSLKNSELLNPGRVIISDEEIQADRDRENLAVSKENIYFTTGFGNIGMRIYSDNNITIGREGYWLS